MPSPTHAGSWYASDPNELARELDSNLAKVKPIPELHYDPPVKNAKAIIAPHAGYSYSGPAAAWAYAAIPTDKIKRVFLLGLSHHTALSGISLSAFESYATPLGDLPLDTGVIQELKNTHVFTTFSKHADEDEHSLEMHLPYIRHIFKGRDDIRLVPLIVGHPKGNADEYSKVLEKYYRDPETFFVVSSDFCHWGTRFSHTPYYPHAPPPPAPVPPVEHSTLPAAFEPPQLMKRYKEVEGGVPIWQSIQFMDHEGIDLLRRPAGFGAVEKWLAYLRETGNTVCGRNPITTLLRLIQFVHPDEDNQSEFTFVRYEQSSKCMTGRDSSVSYVSGVLRVW